MEKLKRFLNHIEETIAGVCLLVMVLFVFTNVFGRLVFQKSFAALDEISYTLYAYVIFVGSSSLYKRYGHGVIDLVVKLLPKRLQAAISFLVTLFLLGVSALVTYLSAGYCAQAWTRRTQTLHWPYSITAFALVLGFFFMTIHSFFLLKNVITKKDYFHEIPIYKDMFTVDSVEDMVADTMEQKAEQAEGGKAQ